MCTWVSLGVCISHGCSRSDHARRFGASPFAFLPIRLFSDGESSVTRCSAEFNGTRGTREHNHSAGGHAIRRSQRQLRHRRGLNASLDPVVCGILNGATRRQFSQRLDQNGRRKWLDKKSDAADFHGPPFDRFTIVRTHEYDGDREACVCKALRKCNTATLAKLNIDNEADRFSRHRSIQELFSGSIEFRVVPECRQQTAHGAEDTEVIVDYCDSTLLWHEFSGPECGRMAPDTRRCGRLHCRLERGFWWAPLYVRIRMHVLLSCAKALSPQASRNHRARRS